VQNQRSSAFAGEQKTIVMPRAIKQRPVITVIFFILPPIKYSLSQLTYRDKVIFFIVLN